MTPLMKQELILDLASDKWRGNAFQSWTSSLILSIDRDLAIKITRCTWKFEFVEIVQFYSVNCKPTIQKFMNRTICLVGEYLNNLGRFPFSSWSLCFNQPIMNFQKFINIKFEIQGMLSRNTGQTDLACLL